MKTGEFCPGHSGVIGGPTERKPKPPASAVLEDRNRAVLQSILDDSKARPQDKVAAYRALYDPRLEEESCEEDEATISMLRSLTSEERVACLAYIDRSGQPHMTLSQLVDVVGRMRFASLT